MNCPNCGTSNLENASICVNCGRPLTGAAPPPPVPPPQQQATYTPPPPSYAPQPPMQQIPNYLWQSIVVTLCCCLPLGIVAIIFAAQVNDKFNRGDVAGAMNASKQAKMWCWIAFGLGLLAWLVWMVFYGAVIMQAIREGQINR